ncbi:MAG: GNAT family N-acetyltransferase, partial [Sphaerochaetaceae bacterium]
MIQRLVETQKVISLFAGCHETILKSCMQGIMGDVYVDDREHPHSAFALIGDFCLLAGTPSKELLTFQEQCNNYWETRLLVPQNEDWEQMIRKTYGNYVQEITRYALKKDAHFDKVALSLAISSLSPTYQLREIDEILYHYLKTEIW